VSTSEAVRDDETVSEPVLVVRTFQAEVQADFAKREIEGIIVPFDVEATVADPPEFRPYTESVARGAFRSIVNAPNRVLLDFEHYGALTYDALASTGSIAGTLGHATHLAEEAGHLYGCFRVLRGSDGDKALELADEGVLGGFSVAMKPLRSARTSTGVQRLKVHLDRVSLCRKGSYEQSRVMAVRTEQQFIEPEHLGKPLDPVLAASLLRLGVKVPEHLLPEEPDNEEESNDEGTSEATS
jgi:HK97 family phage prohead protease